MWNAGLVLGWPIVVRPSISAHVRDVSGGVDGPRGPSSAEPGAAAPAARPQGALRRTGDSRRRPHEGRRDDRQPLTIPAVELVRRADELTSPALRTRSDAGRDRITDLAG